MDAKVASHTIHSVGVDLGGTKVAAALFTRAGELIGEIFQAPTLADQPREATLASIDRVIAAAMASNPSGGIIAGIGVGSTGPLDPDSGTILEAETLPALFHFPLAKTLEDRFGAAVRITNDANAFTLAEATHGAGRGHSIVMGITLGTGCGCGVVLRGAILEGASANTGEVYRAPLDGRTFDEVLSGTGLELRYRQRAKTSASGAEIDRRAREGEAAAHAAFDDFGADVAAGLGILAAVVDPGVIVLGGSVSSSYPHFRAALERELPRHVAPGVARGLRVVPAHLGARAGVLGAAALVFAGESIR